MKLARAVAISLVPCALAAAANAQSCLTGPTKTKDGTLQTWTVVNRCGAPVTLRYSLTGPMGKETKSAIVSACSRQRIVQIFETDRIDFLDTGYGQGWEKICPSLDDEISPRKRPEKSTNETDQIPFPSISPPPLAGPKPIGPAGGKPIPKG
ncbi:hypothetical protein JQ616_09490 [Bradyrhizobium tropiciagri]|uniref:hypothetical protein n=1 Tax=Bradyrhizobium tropiciagri TaxID=312253 RepID=UPI001BAA5306|nr:hypothetical protein [Bradyrhizobium tropiciagri]MBR0895177.1 hypothetical protein [Bradyrhizobium tropiciagri]